MGNLEHVLPPKQAPSPPPRYGSQQHAKLSAAARPLLPDHPRLVTLRHGPDTHSISCTSTHNHIMRTMLNFGQVQLWLCPTALLTATKDDSRPIAFKQEIK